MNKANAIFACDKPGFEVQLNSIVASLLLENRLPPGDIVDAGAFNGEWACYWATVARSTADPNRTVIAIDPDQANIDYMRNEYQLLPNLRPVIGLLSDRGGRFAAVDDEELGAKPYKFFGGERIRTHNRSEHYRKSLRLPVFTIDSLFLARWRRERLALLHLDLEGSELLALRGANTTLSRDRPVVVTELNVHGTPALSAAVLAHMASRGYDSYLIEEITGIRADLRNVLHLPRERRRTFEGSSALDLAVATRGLLAVNTTTLPQMAFPCCALGAECCPVDAAGRTHACCSHARVHSWISRTVQQGGHDLMWFTRTTWYDQHWHVWRRGRELLHLQQELWARSAGGAIPPGFTYNTPPGPIRVRPTFSPKMSDEARARARKALKVWKVLRVQDMAERRRESDQEEALLRMTQNQRLDWPSVR